MEYSDDNLMKLLNQVSHQTGHGPKRGPEGRGEHGEHGGYGADGKSDAANGGRVGYPNCPGPGCGNNCPYKGTQDCPKVAARSAAGQGEGSSEHGEHGEHGDGRRQGREGRGEHGDHGDHGEHGGHGGHGDGRWQGRDGRGEYGGHGEHGDHGDYDGDAAHSPMGRERVLTILNEEGSMSQSKLAEKLEIRPQSVSELLGKLESDGYIVRSQNNQDKRESLVSLSEEGKKRADEVSDLQAKHTAEFLAPLDEDEKQTLFNLLTKLTGGKAEE